MRRLLCSVGCNAYDELDSLSGAELDAENVYSSLVSSEYKSYDADSCLLMSPSYSEFRGMLQEILLGDNCPDVFTLYFAGHGGVNAGSYYLCLKDTKKNVAFNGVPLSDLFTLINSSSVSQVFVILDSCQSGGVAYDMNYLMKGEKIGHSGSKSIALLAAAASDQYALESSSGGLLTNYLIDVLSGGLRISDDRKYFDLVEIGRALSKVIIANCETQIPSSWGINLYGEGLFAINPFFSGGQLGFDVYETIPASSDLGKKIAFHYKEISQLHVEVEQEVDAAKIAALLLKIKHETFDEDKQFGSFLMGLLSSLRSQALKSTDLFAESTLISAFIPILCQLEGDLRDQFILILAKYRHSAALRELDEVRVVLRNDQTALLDKKARSGALPLFYCLPLRVSKFLGWAGLLLLESRYLGIESSIKRSVSSLIAEIVDDYPRGFCAVTERQACHVFVGIKGLLAANCGHLALHLLLEYMESVGNNWGEVCKINATGEEILTFLSLFGTRGLKSIPKIVSSPTHFLCVLLLLAKDFGLNAEVDHLMHLFDRKTVYAYVSNDYGEFSDVKMEDGINLSLQVGFSFWTLDEFIELFEKSVKPKLAEDSSLNSHGVQYAAIVSSLVYEDRLPLFL